jgi:hypothetical protein
LMRHKVATSRRSRKVRVQNSWIFCCGCHSVSQSWLWCWLLFTVCWSRSLEEGSTVWLCGWERVQAMDAWEKEEGGACVQPLEVCHQSDLLLGPSFRLGPLPWSLE